MNKIRKGDEVVVMVGKDRNRRGTVSKVLEDGRVIVTGINVAKKHQKPNPNAGVAGGIIEKEMPIHHSNLKVWNPGAKKGGAGDRVGFKVVGTGDAAKKVRIFKSTGEVVEG